MPESVPLAQIAALIAPVVAALASASGLLWRAYARQTKRTARMVAAADEARAEAARWRSAHDQLQAERLDEARQTARELAALTADVGRIADRASEALETSARDQATALDRLSQQIAIREASQR